MEGEVKRGRREAIKNFLFRNTTVTQTVAKNAFWLGISTIASRLIKAILIIYAARALGTEGYGIFSYTLSLAAFFAIFSDIGVSGVLTREISKEPKLLSRYFSTGFAIKLSLLAISIGLIIGVAPFFTKIPEALPLLPLAALLIAFDGIRDFTFSVTRAKENMQIEAGVSTATNVAITAFGLAALLTNASPALLLTGYAVGSGTGTLLSLWVSKIHFRRWWMRIDKKLIKNILWEAWPFALTGLLGTIMGNTDSIMLGWLKGADDVGLYSAAFRPVQLLYFIPVIVAMSVFPTLSRSANADKPMFRNVLEHTLAMLFLLSIPMAVGGTLVAPDIIGLVFGATYLPATLAFTILLFTLITNFPTPLLSNAMFSYRKRAIFVASLAIGAVGNIILNLFLIPRYGIMGSAIATLVAQFLVASSMVYTLKRVNYFAISPHLRRVALAVGGMALAVWGLEQTGVHVVINIILGGLIYLTLLLLFREPLLKRMKGLFVLR